MELTGAPAGTQDLTEAADGGSVTRVKWEVDGSAVESEFGTGWLGVTDDVRNAMRDLGIPEKLWLGRGITAPEDLLPGFKISEARVGYVQGVEKDGTDWEIVMNFLASERKEFREAMLRYEYLGRTCKANNVFRHSANFLPA